MRASTIGAVALVAILLQGCAGYGTRATPAPVSDAGPPGKARSASLRLSREWGRRREFLGTRLHAAAPTTGQRRWAVTGSSHHQLAALFGRGSGGWCR